MNMSPQVAIIIVNWNGKGDTLECLESLRGDTYPNKRIIVVDNGSEDGSVAAIREAFAEVTVIEAGRNLGFTGGNNIGIRRALEEGSDYVYLLNNDTISEPAALSELVRAAEQNPRFGILTPVIHYADDPSAVWFAGSKLDLSRGIAVHDNASVPDRQEGVREIPWASGCAMLMPAEVIRRLEGFDERFFLNWEDVDLSLRVRRLGKGVGLVPAARIFHKVSRSFRGLSGRGRYYHVRNQLLLMRLHGGENGRAVRWRVALVRLREGLGSAGRSRHGEVIGPTIRAIRDHMRGRYGAAVMF